MSNLFKILDEINAAGNINNSICDEKELKNLIENLQTYFQEAQLLFGDVQENYQGDYSKVVALIYPNLKSNCVLQLLCVSFEDSNQMTSLFLRLLNIGNDYQGLIEEIYTDKYGSEAYIDFKVLNTNFIFYDFDFGKNRDFYQKDNKFYGAKIYGLGYLELDKNIYEPIYITRETNSDLFDALKGDSDSEAPLEIITQDMNFFLPTVDIEEEGYQSYQIRGKILAVSEINLDFPENKKIWLCSCHFWEEEEMPNLEIVISQIHWEEEEAPKVGDVLAGNIILVGHIPFV